MTEWFGKDAIFADARVLVTAEIVTIDGVSYAVRNITSVLVREQPRKGGWFPTALMLVGGLLVLVGLGGSGGALMLGVCMFGGGLSLTGKNARFALMLGSAGGERQALESDDQTWLGRVRNAIEEAMRK